MNSNKVAIIGCGRAGLVSAKYALEYGLEPVIFEKTNQVGGLWSRNNDTAIWDGMFTNITKYTMMFHDHPWPKDTPIFLTVDQVHEYLMSYAQKFNLFKHIRFEIKIEYVKKLNCKWELTWFDINTKSKITEEFDYLIISSGLYTKPRIPSFENSTQFKGIQMHSCEYRLNDSKLKDKKVIILGCSISGTEIAASLVGHARDVTNIFSRPYLVSSRMVHYKISESKYKILPRDLFFYRRLFHYPDSSLSKDEVHKLKIDTFKRAFPYQTDAKKSHPDLFVDLDVPKPIILHATSDYYIPYVIEQKIKPIKSNIKKFNEHSILLENGHVEECDAIIYCTGYDLALDFLDKSILDCLKFDPRYPRFSFVSYKGSFHPNLENFAMIGQVGGTFYTGSELQAHWACKVFSGKCYLPDKEVMLAEIEEDLKRRDEASKEKYPLGGYTILNDKIAKASGQLPDFDKLKSENEVLYNKLWSTGLQPNHYFLNKEISSEILDELYEINSREFYINDNEDCLNFDDFVKEFSKVYKFPKGLFKL